MFETIDKKEYREKVYKKIKFHIVECLMEFKPNAKLSIFKKNKNVENHDLYEVFNFDGIYKILFNAFDYVTYKSIDRKSDSDKLLKQYKIKTIQAEAILKNATPIIKLKLFSKFNANIKIGEFVWNSVRSSLSTKTGYIFIDTKGYKEEVNFVLNKPIVTKNIKQYKLALNLENKSFVNEYNLVTDKQLLIKRIFTPLATDEIIKLDNIKQTQKWNCQKNKEGVIINFAPIDSYQLQPYQHWHELMFEKSKNQDKLLEVIISRLINDTYELYLILSTIMVTSLLQ